MHALAKFKQCLVRTRFIVRTDHNSLKYFLEQMDLNEQQQKWVSKIQAYDFDVEYVKGKKNVVADALSRKPTLCSLTEILADWKMQLLVEYSKNPFACDLIDGKVQDDRYAVMDDIFYFKNKIYLLSGSKLKKKILEVLHDSPVAGHPGFFKPIARFMKGLPGKD